MSEPAEVLAVDGVVNAIRILVLVIPLKLRVDAVLTKGAVVVKSTIEVQATCKGVNLGIGSHLAVLAIGSGFYARLGIAIGP